MPPGSLPCPPPSPADSCKRLEWLHDRMPVILRSQEAQRTWLDVEDKGSMG